MHTVMEWLDTSGVFFLATADGPQPKLRPIGAHMEKDGKVLFSIGSHKEVYKQLLGNPHCQIAGMLDGGRWFRLTGRAVFEDGPAYAERFLEARPGLRKIYNPESGLTLAVFHLEEARALLYAMGDVVGETAF